MCAHELIVVLCLFLCRTIFEHLGAVQVNRQRGEAVWKKCRFTEGRGECRLCGGGGWSRISSKSSLNGGKSIVGFCVMGGDDEPQRERGRQWEKRRRDSRTAESTQRDRGRERKTEWEISADVICGGVRERKRGSKMALEKERQDLRARVHLYRCSVWRYGEEMDQKRQKRLGERWTYFSEVA